MRTFVDDDRYSNYLGVILPAGIVNKQVVKRKDAQQRERLAQIEQDGARQRLEFAKTFEERRKAEKDLRDAEEKVAQAKSEQVATTEQPQPKPSNTKKYLLIGGGVLVVGFVLYLALRKN